MGRRKAAKKDSRQKSDTSRSESPIGAVVPLKRTGRRRVHELPSGEPEPSLHDLISEGQQQQADLLKLRWQRDLSLGVAVAILLCFLAALWWVFERPRRSSEANSTAPSTRHSSQAPVAVTAPAVAPSNPQEDIVRTVKAWAAAWSAQDVDAYLSFYAAEFQVPGEVSRQAWEAQRRQRLQAPELIAVALRELEVELTGPDTATARFVQTYASPGYADQVSKTLAMVQEAGRWQILEELSS